MSLQEGIVSGKVTMKVPISGSVSVGSRNIRELRFLPFTEFPAVGSSDILYIDTDLNDIYWYDGEAYQKCTPTDTQNIIDDLNTGTNKTWSSDKIQSELDDDQSQIDNLGNIVPLTNLEIAAILAK